MKLLIAGGTGLIGQSLIPFLLKQGNHITVMGRDLKKIISLYSHTVSALSWSQLDSCVADDFDAVINLVGENIADKKWSASRKYVIKQSRINATDKIAKWLSQAKNKKPHLYNASAVGVYGAHAGPHELSPCFTEAWPLSTEKNPDFCSELVQQWEAATQPAREAGIPVTFLRFGVVLKRQQGILKKLYPSFFLGLGSVIGNGQQSFSWISVDDLIRAIFFLLQTPTITGPVNVCSPQCVTQGVFAQALAKVLHRPLLLTLPAWVVRILFGQMGQELLLSGQNVYPQVLEKHGFTFLYPDIYSALEQECCDKHGVYSS